MLKFLIDARTISNVLLFILRDTGGKDLLRRIPHTSHGSFNPYLNQDSLQASSCSHTIYNNKLTILLWYFGRV